MVEDYHHPSKEINELSEIVDDVSSARPNTSPKIID